MKDFLTLLNLNKPKMTADFESNAPTGLSLSDVKGMEQLLIGLQTHTGQIVTPAKAMRTSAVLACMRIISEDLSALRLPLYRATPNGVEEAKDHPLYHLIDVAPNDIMTSMDLREHVIYDLMLNGNFFVLLNEDNAGDIKSLWPLQAGYCTRRYQELIWTFSDPVTGVSGQFDTSTVWRGQMLSGNSIDGQALMLLAREAIGLLLAAEEQGARLFKYGVQSDLTLSTDGDLDTDSKDQLRQAFMQRHAGSGNAFMPLLLENGMKAARIGLTAQESQYIESRKFQIEDIARVWRVPEVLLGNSTSGKSSTYASAEQFFQSYTKHTLTPWAVRLEQTMSRDLLTPQERAQGYFFRHDFTSLLRGDTAARYASYSVGIDKGFLSPAFAREQENFPYVAGLDYYAKPAPPAPAGDGPGPDDKAAPTDQSGKDNLPRRVAHLILKKETRALLSAHVNPEVYYAHFAGFVEDLTGGDLDRVMTYCEMRRKTEDRFSEESKAIALQTLISLCKKEG